MLVAGTLIRVDQDALVIQPRWKPSDAEPLVVHTDAGTRFLLDMERTGRDQLKPGMELTVRREPPTARDASSKMFVHAWSPALSGTVSRIDGNRMVIKITPAGDAPREVVVDTDGDTKVHTMREGGGYFPELGLIKVEELEPGMNVRVVPTSGIARKIFVVPPRASNASTTQSSK